MTHRTPPLAWHRISYGLLPVLLVAVLAACDATNAAQQASPESSELATMTDELAKDLELTPAATSDLKASFANHEERMQEPGFLWYVAADLQATLTDEQKERLYSLLERTPPRFGPEHRGGPFQRRMHHAFRQLDLTDEQQEALQAIREEYAPAFQELREQVRNDEITHDAFRTEMEELHDAMREDIEAVLTDEQLEQLDALREDAQERRGERRERFEEHREDAQAVMVEVLGLTQEQQEQLQTLREEQYERRQELGDQLRNGDLTRADMQEEIHALRDAHQEALAEILNDEQYEIAQIHRVLTLRRMNAMRPHRGRHGHR